MSWELISLVVNGVRVDFITPSRLLSLNKHPPVTSLTLRVTEAEGEGRGIMKETDNNVEC